MKTKDLKNIENYLTRYLNVKCDRDVIFLFNDMDEVLIDKLLKIKDDELANKVFNNFEITLLNELGLIAYYYKEINMMALLRAKDKKEVYKNPLVQEFCSKKINDENFGMYDVALKYCDISVFNYETKMKKEYSEIIGINYSLDRRKMTNISIDSKMNMIINAYKNSSKDEQIVFYIEKHLKLSYNIFINAISKYKETAKEEIDVLKDISRIMFVKNNLLYGMLYDISNGNDIELNLKKLRKNVNCNEDIYVLIARAKNSKLLSLTNEQITRLNNLQTRLHNEEITNKKNIEQKKYQHLKDEARYIVETFINSSYNTKQAFCNFYGIRVEKFNACIECLKILEDDMYIKYINYIEDYEKIVNDSIEVANDMYIKLTEGIKEDGVVRKYDMIDFYMSTTLTPIKFLNKIRNKINAKKYNVINRFLSMKHDTKLTSDFVNAKIYFNTKYDLKGNLIPDSLREVSKEEKELVLTYLESLGLEKTNLAYRDLLRRYINGYIKIDTKDKVKIIEK